MNGTDTVILDSNVLIYRSKNLLDLREFFGRYKNVAVSVITYMETLGHRFENSVEEETIRQILETLIIVQTDMNIAEKVIAYKQIRRIKTPDAIILATASYLDADLITVNESDFKGLDPAVRIIVPMLLP
ncbi:MAG: type II toxin-antitoxin system VapC family toxin [Saprospiraceae bacterium]|nr:type II toxin-antitoxin system VapC family toxin [Saprospiraceae bacterium]